MAAPNADPSHHVHGDLLPHVHLLSAFRYVQTIRVEHGEVAKWLMDAPKIARSQAPFFWTYLEIPSPGSIFLTWQPLGRLGTDFASDGYFWAGAETMYSIDLGNGIGLEMYYIEAGFRPGDQVTSVCRRRFRLVPSNKLAPAPGIDQSLWIVHWGPTEKRMPVNMVPQDPRQVAIMQTRHYLKSFGELLRKEFMLSDRPNWPQIPFPSAGRHPMFGAPGRPRNVPQHMAYPPQQAPPAAPAPKRQKITAAAQGQHHPVIGAMPQENVFDDDEDTSRGDMFDQITPRELAIARFQQNHEWLEEVLSSPYRMGQIEFSDLGLGLKGELSALTEGIMPGQGYDALRGLPKDPYVGHLDEGKADLFRKRVSEHIASTNAEIERMKAEHEKALAKFKTNSLIMAAEKDLRSAVHEAGPEYWHLEGKTREDDGGTNKWSPRHPKKIDDIVASVESALGRHAQVVKDVQRVQDGGYLEPTLEPEPPAQAALDPMSMVMSRQPSHNGSQHSGLVIGDSDIEMGGTAGSLLDQMHTGGMSSTSTPNNFPTPQAPLSTIPSAANTPAGHVPSPHPTQTVPDLPTVQESAKEDKMTPTAPDQGTGSGDWIMVPKGGASPAVSGPGAAMGSSMASTMGTKPTSMAGTPGEDFSSLPDLDTAGEVMETLNNPGLDSNDLDLDMEDTNFGDAFHGMGVSDGNTPSGL